jgi:hypothetical protein
MEELVRFSFVQRKGIGCYEYEELEVPVQKIDAKQMRQETKEERGKRTVSALCGRYGTAKRSPPEASRRTGARSLHIG